MITEDFGAGERFRTVDLVLGKHTLYQLSYTRSGGRLSIVITGPGIVNVVVRPPLNEAWHGAYALTRVSP